MISVMFGIDNNHRLNRAVAMSPIDGTFDIDAAIRDALQTPITHFSDQQIDAYINRWMPTANDHDKAELRTLLTDIVFPCQFEDATPHQCQMLHAWWRGMTRTPVRIILI